MSALLALLSALAYGAGDFLGGLCARRLPAPGVVLRANTVGLLALLPAAALISAEVTPVDLAWGGLGGIVGSVAILLLYWGLATGTMSVVAPISAVLAAVVPVVVGLISGERPSALALAGIPVALVAIATLGRDPHADPSTSAWSRRALLLALGAGFGFGLFFVTLDAAGDDAGLWPAVAGRITSVAMYGIVVAAVPGARTGDHRARTGSTPWLLAGCGLCDAGANALFLLATQGGLLTLVAVLGALYPASTLVLARLVLGERLVRSQRIGLALAGLAVVAVSAG